MDVFGTLPVWVQLLIGFLVAGVLIVMNIGWLIQARGWLDQQKRRQRGTGATTGTTTAGTPAAARSERDRA